MTPSRRWLTPLAFGALALLWLEGLRVVGGAPFSWRDLGLVLFLVLAVLFVARVCEQFVHDARRTWPALGLALVGVLAWTLYEALQATTVAWVALAVTYVVLLELDQVLLRGRGVWVRWGIHIAFALIAGAIPVAVVQVESHFADEEFFVALQALALAAFWLILLIVQRTSSPSESAAHSPRPGLGWPWLGVVLLLAVAAGSVFTLRSYQESFFPTQVPGYTGISAEMPFLCGSIAPEAQTFDGRDVFQRLLERVRANPYKGAPEYGMLALATTDRHWADEFRSSLLTEASRALFTGPSNSVKSSQYDAARRVYYFAEVKRAFPDLFTPADESQIRQWLAAINRRAQTVEWVDWMYALAFAKWPEGPYENQENGAGLLALLQATGYAAPELAAANQDYLARNPRGWTERFRNTDDAFVYQPEWIDNAFFQSLLTGETNRENMQRAFDWMLLQAPPDGSPFGYNHPETTSLAPVAYLGARLLGDARLVWLAGKAVADLEARGDYIFAQPGIEKPVDLPGRAPTEGSCFLYGDSGLPNQRGPLAPDKLVFRDNWSDQGTLLLLNLRFTGWHRYKASNTITLVYQGKPLVADDLSGQPFAWLPVGRSLFRDKRIPRENLSGLLIERTGMSVVLYTLTGIGGPWAQDPPFYARVDQFKTGAEMDMSTTVLENWHGWQSSRSIYFFHGGPIAVIDNAKGPAGQAAALVWHTLNGGQWRDQRVKLSTGEQPAEILFVPIGSGQLRDEADDEIVYTGSADGRLSLATIFLTGDWVGAQANVRRDAGRPTLEIVRGDKRVMVPLPDGGG